MKKIIPFSILLISFFSIQAQKQWMPIQGNQETLVSKKLVSQTENETIITFQLDGFYLEDVATPQGNSVRPVLDEAFPLLIKGAPDLLRSNASFIIPDEGTASVEILSSNYTEYQNIEIAPSKGNLYRDQDPANIPYSYGKMYEHDAFYPSQLADLGKPYILRDFRAQVVFVYPFHYNPVTKILRVYQDITVKVSVEGKGGTNAFARTKKPQNIDPVFSSIYERSFINYSKQKYTPLSEHGNFLIICPPSYQTTMQALVDWKTMIGIPTEMVTTTTAGTSATAIKNYISNYYNTNGLTFVLLVGDASEIPTNNLSAGHSDNAYGYISGNDHYQEVIVGRFSGTSTSHIQTQVQRTIEYEMVPAGGSIYSNAIGIASNQGPGDDNEYDYQHINNMLSDYLSFTYTTVAEFYEGSQGGNDDPGDPSSAMVSAEINKGASSILYCGHGSTTTFVTSGFSNSHINALTNVGKLPFIWSVACVNGNFVNNTCFAEAWMRATDGNGSPTGAIATLMSTINQSWDPPMEGQDEMVDILTETYPSNIKRTFGGLSVNGLFKMNDTYTSQGYEMTDTWTLFGDPSVMVRTDNPQTMTVSHAPTAFIGATSFQVNSSAEGAHVCLSMNNQILATGTITGGTVTIPLNPALSSVDTMTVAITAFNYIPYIGEVPIISASGPYVAYQSKTINDAAGNNNSVPETGENIVLGVSLQNLGVATANAVNASLSSSDPMVTITDTSENFGNIALGSSAARNSAYVFNIAANVPDQHSVPFDLAISDNSSNTWNSSFTITMSAPDLAIGGILINDAAGNNNGVLDPGESVTMLISSLNNGHADAASTQGSISCSSSNITINTASHSFGNLAQGTSQDGSFSLSVSPSAPLGTTVDIDYTLSSGLYTATHTFTLTIGLVSEDWETGDFTQYAWSGNNRPWVITTQNPYEGNSCAVSANINDNQSSTLEITMNVLSNDSISFFKKVSCEDGSSSGNQWDFLEFFIDNTSMGWWDGEVAWSREAFPVAAGTHTFKWVYEKDYYVSSGSDCAWVDYIVFPPVQLTTGTNEVPSLEGVRIYPNPSSSSTEISWWMNESGNVRIDIYNTFGQMVSNVIVENTGSGAQFRNLNTETLSSGLYFIHISTPEGVQSLRFVKSK